ncbi:hypothetical protein [Acidiphilium angustum]|uniref:hypothetical protein n=1 Tax=Acidiphilium angustum TaxID=523 RepID=UPI000A471425|nr:hypothetical protein [Acidiphilium angustum]
MVYRAFPTLAPAPPVVQLPLPIPLPRCTLSDLAQEVLVIVTRLAEGRIEMPTYPVLGIMASNRGRQSVAKAFDRLVNLGLVRVETRRTTRRVLVVGTGNFTGWGEWVDGHAPHSAPSQAPLDPTAIVAVEGVRRPSPMTPEGEMTVAQYLRSLPRPTARPDPGPSRNCQYIKGEISRGVVEFCNAKSRNGKSWCDDHLKIVFDKHSRRST